MVDLYIVAILISEIISTLAIFKLLRYTIVRYQTNERGGIHTGFASAGIVMIISGMCFHCSLKTIESLIYLCSNVYHKSMKNSGAMMVLQNLSYLFSTSWINAVCFTLTKRAVSLKEPKKNNSRKSYGFSHTQFFRWMVYPLTIEMGYVTASIVVLCIMHDIELKHHIIFSSKEPIHYLEVLFYIISGISFVASTTALTLFACFMKKSYERRSSKPSVWNRLPRPLKSAIKCCFIMAFLWTTQFTAWIMRISLGEKDEGTVGMLCKILHMIYSFQGLILYCVVYFNRVISDPQSRTGSRSTKQNIVNDENYGATKNDKTEEDCKQPK